MIPNSQLILIDNKKVFHLHLEQGILATKIILVGDPNRVQLISQFFDQIVHTSENREYISATGYYKGKKLSVLSTGVGMGNIDIVMNEIDALFNIDFENRQIKEDFTPLEFVRIGTSGSIQPDIPLNAFVISAYSIGLDGLLNFYEDENSVLTEQLKRAFGQYISSQNLHISPYAVKSSEEIVKRLSTEKTYTGITLTAPGFYAPQGRQLRVKGKYPHLKSSLEKFEFDQLNMTNYEMESAPMTGMAAIMGHKAATICLIAASRAKETVNPNYYTAMEELIVHVLEKI